MEDNNLTIEEVFFVKNAVEGTQIKAVDAGKVAQIILKLDQRFLQLQQEQQAAQMAEMAEQATKK